MVAQQETPSASLLHFDDEAARRLEEIYSHPDVIARRHRVREALALRPGERVLDIGCGPGFQTGEIAAVVGPNGWVSGVDISEAVLATARQRSAGQPYAAWIDFLQGDAVSLPFPDASFDAVVATQVYEYVREVPAALAELHRVLRPGGRAVVVDTDWDTLVWQSTDGERTARILSAWGEHLADPYLPRTLRPALRRAGFEVSRVEPLTVLNLEWAGYSKGVSGLVAAFVAGRHGLTEEDTQGWIADLRTLGEDDAYFFSLDQYLFLASKPAA